MNKDLIAALKEGKIAAALLDVVEGEPDIDGTHELFSEGLKDKVAILPHAASAEVRTRREMADVAVRDILTTLGFEEGLGDREHLERRKAWTHFAN